MMDDRELERIAARLGGRAAAALDVERVARRVVARLRAEPPARRHMPAARWLALAAAVVLLIAGSVFTVRNQGAGTMTVLPVAVAPALDQLSEPELAEVLDSLSWEAPASTQLATTHDDLDATQLRELLALIEG
jgi:hypothetical protein